MNIIELINKGEIDIATDYLDSNDLYLNYDISFLFDSFLMGMNRSYVNGYQHSYSGDELDYYSDSSHTCSHSGNERYSSSVHNYFYG